MISHQDNDTKFWEYLIVISTVHSDDNQSLIIMCENY